METNTQSIILTDPAIIESFKKDIRCFFDKYLHVAGLFRLPYCKIVIEAPKSVQSWSISFSATGELDIQRISFLPIINPKKDKTSHCYVTSNGKTYEPLTVQTDKAVQLYEKFDKLPKSFNIA